MNARGEIQLMDFSQVSNLWKDFHVNALELAVLALFVILVITGMRQGLIRKLTAVLSLVLSIALISVLLPHVTGYLKEHTPAGEIIEEQCRAVLDTQLQRAVSALDESAAARLEAAGAALYRTDQNGNLEIGR